MSEFGKTIELYLLSGNFDGIVTAELSNWNGKAFKVPRENVQSFSDIDFEGVGVYFLISHEDEPNLAVYIGESENVKVRLTQHIASFPAKESFFWSEVVVFTGRDLDRTSIRYLEDRLCSMAKEAKSYTLLTKNSYSKTRIKDSREEAMKEFLSNVRILLKTLGYRMLEPVSELPGDAFETKHVFMQYKGKSAFAIYTGNGKLLVLEGSQYNITPNASFKAHKLKSLLENEGIICNGVFTQNYLFSSVSSAASIVAGNPMNGWDAWGDSTGKKLNEIVSRP